jgi:hypothetical protein
MTGRALQVIHLLIVSALFIVTGGVCVFCSFAAFPFVLVRDECLRQIRSFTSKAKGAS